MSMQPDTLPKPEKRKPLTRLQFATLILAQDGKCGCGCGIKLQADRIIDEHLNPLDSLGSNDLSNRALFALDCAKRKTEADRAARDKGRRLRGEVGNGPKRAIQSRSTFDQPPLPNIKARISKSPGSITSAGFKKHPTMKRSLSGKVVPRD